MTKHLLIGVDEQKNNFYMPLDAVCQTFGILAKKGAGKSYAAAVVAEEILRLGAQVCILDPLDAFFGLRSSADGKSPGFPIVVIGGEHGDLPLASTSGSIIADFVVEHGVSVILSTRHLSGNEQRQFATDFAERLYKLKGESKNRTPLHLIIDECDEFIPQKIYHGHERMFGAFDRIIRRGRSSGIGVTMISQRPAVINKDCLTQVETLIALRLISPQDRKAVEAWIESHDVDNQRVAFMESLASLDVGTAWVWSPGWLNCFTKVKIRKRTTYDSSFTPKAGEKKIEPKKLAQVDIDALKAKLSATIDQKKADDPKELRKKITTLENQLKDLNARALKACEVTPQQKVFERQACILESGMKAIEKLISDINKNLESEAKFSTPAKKGFTFYNGHPKTVEILKRMHGDGLVNPVEISPSKREVSGIQLSKCARILLDIICTFGSVKKAKLAITAQYSVRSSTFANALSELRVAKLIYGGDPVMINQDGQIVGSRIDLPEGSALARHWISKIGGCGGKILEVLTSGDQPEMIHRTDIAVKSGYSETSSTFNNAISTLNTLELIEKNGTSIAAVKELFD